MKDIQKHSGVWFSVSSFLSFEYTLISSIEHSGLKKSEKIFQDFQVLLALDLVPSPFDA